MRVSCQTFSWTAPTNGATVTLSLTCAKYGDPSYLTSISIAPGMACVDVLSCMFDFFCIRTDNNNDDDVDIHLHDDGSSWRYGLAKCRGRIYIKANMIKPV